MGSEFVSHEHLFQGRKESGNEICLSCLMIMPAFLLREKENYSSSVHLFIRIWKIENFQDRL